MDSLIRLIETIGKLDPIVVALLVVALALVAVAEASEVASRFADLYVLPVRTTAE